MTSNDILGFGSPQPDPEEVAHGIEDVAGALGSLVETIVDAIGREIRESVEAGRQLDQVMLEAIEEPLLSANKVSTDSQERIVREFVNQLGAVEETAAALEGRALRAGRGPDTIINFDPTAEEFIAAGGPTLGGAALDDPIATDVPPPDQPAITEDLPPATGPPTIVPPPPTLPPPPPATKPPPPQTIQPPPPFLPPPPGPQQPPVQPPQPQPQPTVVVQGGGPQCPPANVTVVCPPGAGPGPAPQPQPQPQPEEEPDRPRPAPPPTGQIPSGEATHFCEVDAYASLDASDYNLVGRQVERPLTSFFWPHEHIDDVIARLARERDALGFLNPERVVVAFKLGAAWTLRNVENWWLAIAGIFRGVNPLVGVLLGYRGLLYLLGVFFGPMTAKVDQQLKYGADSLYPVGFPDQNEATEAYVRGTIDHETLRTWVQQNDRCWAPWERLVESRTDRVDPLMALQMFKRGLITEQQFEHQIRKAGYTQEELQDAWRGLEDFVPPITDLVRFMVRDVEDETNIDWTTSDEVFGKKWTGRTKEWGEMQGITEDQAIKYWRAHWRIPSPTQLYEMFHRSRHLPDDHALKTSKEDVLQALQQDDFAPQWTERLLNNTFRRLSRVDARRAYETGAITEEMLRNEFVQLGYPDEAVDALVRWARINKLRVVSNRPEMRLFRDGMIEQSEAEAILRETKMEPSEISRVIELLNLQRNTALTKRCTSAIRERFLTGELDESEAFASLRGSGLSVIAAEQTMASFRCEQQAEGKQPPTNTLCTWLEQGTISPEEYRDRLKRIGWSEADAMRIFVQCQTKINERAAKEAARLAKQEAAAAAKIEREQQAEQRRLEAARRRGLRNLEKAERVKANRRKLLQRATARLAKDTGGEIRVIGDCVEGIERRLAADTLLTADERVQTIVVAIEKLKPQTCEQLVEQSEALATQLLEYGELSEEFLSSFV